MPITFSAYDPDGPGPLTYEILSGEGTEYFDIDGAQLTRTKNNFSVGLEVESVTYTFTVRLVHCPSLKKQITK